MDASVHPRMRNNSTLPPSCRTAWRRVWRGTDAITPGSCKNVIHDQHRHIATDTVALLGNLAERLDHNSAQGRSKGVQLNDIRPCREVRISAIGQDMTVNLNKGLSVRSQLVGRAGHEQLRLARCPRMIRSHVVGDEVQDQAQPPRRKRLPSAGERASAPEMIIDNIAAYAVGRSHNIVGLPIGQSRVEADPQVVIGQRDPDAGGAALPNSHQPHAVESKIGNLLPVAVGNRPKINRPAIGPAETSRPDSSFSGVVRPLEPAPPEYVTLSMRPASDREFVALAQWNMLWEAVQFRHSTMNLVTGH